MHPLAPHISHAARQARLERLDGLIRRAGMKVPPTMKTVAQTVFADGLLPKRQKELTALAVAVAGNCWE
jgi:alkylhydroperoxidase/carboxymuconolactone decarboxylase family protein YurZ